MKVMFGMINNDFGVDINFFWIKNIYALKYLESAPISVQFGHLVFNRK